MSRDTNLIYIGLSRLHRNRANLIQTLHTIAAFEQIGISTTLYLPPWKRNAELMQKLTSFGISRELKVVPVQFLHSRWKSLNYKPFIYTYSPVFRRANAIYTRSPNISIALANANIIHNLEIHDVDTLAKEGLLRSIIEKHQTGKINWLVPISHAAANILKDAGANPEKMHISPSGVDTKAYHGSSSFDPERLDWPRINYIGRASKHHGLDIFIHLAKNNVGDITLIGNQEDILPGGINITIKPFIPHCEVSDWYNKTDIVLLPYQESLEHINSISPMKLFEALASGRPIIASNLPAFREIVKHEESALLIDPKDVNAWLQAVWRLRNDPDLAVRIAKAGHHLAKQYDWKQRATNIANALGWK